MRDEVRQAHAAPMRPESWRGFEPIVQHEALEPCKHPIACKEVQDDGALRRLARFEPGERLRHEPNPLRVTDERRIWRVVQMRRGDHDWGEVTQGIDRPFRPGESVTPPKSVMPSVDNGKDMRMSCKKLERAEFFRKPRRNEVCESEEAEDILRAVGLL